eukprot:c26244_g1_i1 orf=155-325(+)
MTVLDYERELYSLQEIMLKLMEGHYVANGEGHLEAYQLTTIHATIFLSNKPSLASP